MKNMTNMHQNMSVVNRSQVKRTQNKHNLKKNSSLNQIQTKLMIKNQLLAASSFLIKLRVKQLHPETDYKELSRCLILQEEINKIVIISGGTLNCFLTEI